MTRPSWVIVGARVHRGLGQYWEAGRITEVDGDRATVRWDGGSVTTGYWSRLSRAGEPRTEVSR